jgi:hypothetical protein
MPRLLFSNAALLAGLATLAIPILIHLFLRRKRLRLRFSTLQFFIKHNEQDQRRRRLMNVFLLATRLLLLSLLVLAFARPYSVNAPAVNGTRPHRQIVFVLDRSVSMQASDAGTTRWSRAREKLRNMLDELGLEDRVALVEGSGAAAPLSPWVPPPQLKRELERLEPGFGGGELGEGLQQALKLLSLSNRGGQSAIFVISDLQRQSCQKIDAVSIPQNIEFGLLAVGETNTPNSAVSDLALGTGKSLLQATLANFSSEDAKEVRIEWSIDGHATASPSITLTAASTTNVTAPLPSLNPGWHQIEARLQPGDRFPLDDTRRLAVYAPAPLNVFCVEPRQAKHVFEEETFFIVSALQPGGTNSLLSSFHVEKVSPEAVGKLEGASPLQRSMVVVPALPQVPEGCGKSLRVFAQRGGSVLFFVGDGLSASRYNSEFENMLPATLGRTENELAAFEQYWRLGDYDANSPVFAAFRQPRSGDLALPEFWRRFALSPVEGAQVLTRFGDKTPFLLTRRVGQGVVVLVNTSADTAWSDWPKHKTFVPWLHGLCHFLAGDELSLGVRVERALVAGMVSEVGLGSENSLHNFRLVQPGRNALDLKADEQGKFQLPVDRPGFYSLLDSGGNTVRVLAVNTPQRESDLAAFTPGQFQQQLIRTQAIGSNGNSDPADPTDNERNFWRLLMFTGAIILVLETILANRTYA